MGRPAEPKRRDSDAKLKGKEAPGDGMEGRVPGDYRIDEQIGLLVRRVHQRASAIFANHFADAGLSPLQFTTLIKIRDEGRVSQNQLGRLVYTDPATIMGVVSRLSDRELVRRLPDSADKRRTLLTITSKGLKLTEDLEALGHKVTAETLAPLSGEERTELYMLLSKLL